MVEDGQPAPQPLLATFILLAPGITLRSVEGPYGIFNFRGILRRNGLHR